MMDSRTGERWDFSKTLKSSGPRGAASMLFRRNLCVWLTLASVAHFISWSFVRNVLRSLNQYASSVLGIEVVPLATKILREVVKDPLTEETTRSVVVSAGVAFTYFFLLHVTVSALATECVRLRTYRLSLDAIVKILKSAEFGTAVLKTAGVTAVYSAVAGAYFAGLGIIVWIIDSINNFGNGLLEPNGVLSDFAQFLVILSGAAVGPALLTVLTLYSMCWFLIYAQIVVSIVGMVDRGSGGGRLRLGWGRGIWELDNLAFRYLMPLGVALFVWVIIGALASRFDWLHPITWAQWLTCGGAVATVMGTLITVAHYSAQKDAEASDSDRAEVG